MPTVTAKEPSPAAKNAVICACLHGLIKRTLMGTYRRVRSTRHKKASLKKSATCIGYSPSP